MPQDKVSEFAKMSPDMVLKETMRAAGDERLTGWYNELCDKDSRRRAVEQVSMGLANAWTLAEHLLRRPKRTLPS